jgi:hypothetical protein
MPKFVASVARRDTGKDEYLIREAASERELRDALSDEGLVVRSLRPAEFGGKGARFEIRTPKGRVAGPFGPDILRAMVRDGHLTPHCSIRKTGDLDTHAWLPAWKAKGLFPGHVVDSIRRSHTLSTNATTVSRRANCSGHRTNLMAPDREKSRVTARTGWRPAWLRQMPPRTFSQRGESSTRCEGKERCTVQIAEPNYSTVP